MHLLPPTSQRPPRNPRPHKNTNERRKGEDPTNPRARHTRPRTKTYNRRDAGIRSWQRRRGKIRKKIRGDGKRDVEKKPLTKNQQCESIQFMRESPWRQTNAAYSSNPYSSGMYRGRWSDVPCQSRRWGKGKRKTTKTGKSKGWLTRENLVG